MSEDAEAFAYEDRHWRMICLHPFGQAWLNRVEAVAHAVTLHGITAGKLHSKYKLPFELDDVPEDNTCIAMQACTMHWNEGQSFSRVCHIGRHMTA